MSNSWLITGNGGTIGPTNYIGTDGVPLNIVSGSSTVQITSYGQIVPIINSNNISIGRTTDGGNNNVSVGDTLLSNNTDGTDNIAIGSLALNNNTLGSYNIAFGINSLGRLVVGSANTALGSNSLSFNTSASNVAIGFQSLSVNGAGNNNTAYGYGALMVDTNGFNNIAIGAQASSSITNAGSNNVYIGSAFTNIGPNTSFGTNNVCIGLYALSQNIGNNNIAIGVSALRGNMVAHDNIAIGYNAQTTTSDSYNVAIGTSALQNNSGLSNIALGYQAGIRANGTNNIYLGNVLGDVNDDNVIRIGTSSTTECCIANSGINPNTLNLGSDSTTICVIGGLNSSIYAPGILSVHPRAYRRITINFDGQIGAEPASTNIYHSKSDIEDTSSIILNLPPLTSIEEIEQYCRIPTNIKHNSLTIIILNELKNQRLKHSKLNLQNLDLTSDMQKLQDQMSILLSRISDIKDKIHQSST